MIDPDNVTKSHILKLQEAMNQNRLVLFVGAGVSASAGIPSWRDLIKEFKSNLPEEMFDPCDPLKTAQVYRDLRGDVEYQKDLKRILKYGQAGCNQIHDAILKLNPCHIVTTNYDDLLEQSALRNNKQYYVVAKDEDLPANQGEKMLVKMHGDFKENNFVLTENDYYDYSRDFPLIRSFLLSLFSTKVVLFVGFSFNDINLKHILREISSVLDNKMQRVYLLDTQTRSAQALLYYQKKGIQMLYLPKNLTSTVLSDQKISFSNDGLTNERSIALNQGLSLIANYDPYYGDAVEISIKFFKSYDNQIRFWGKGLSKAFPQNKRSGFYISNQNLTLPIAYEKQFEALFETEETLKTFKTKYKNTLEWLIEKMLDNRISSVNKHSITSTGKIRIYEERRYATLNFIYSLDFENIQNRLKELRLRTPNYTIDDLELPYLLFKLGKYYDAFLIFKQLTPEMWKQRKYILYFICLYNIKLSINGYMFKELHNRKDIDFYDLENDARAINLKEVLSDLPIEANVKELFEGLVTGGMVKDFWDEAVKLNDEIYLQRKNAEKGCSSINSNISRLLNNFDQSFFFCNENFILNDSHPYYRDANIKTAEGIINSIMTFAKGNWQTKLEKLFSHNALLFIFMIKPNDLSKMLRRLATGKIPVDESFNKALMLLVKNIAGSIKNKNELMSPNLVANYLLNIIIMLNAIENPPIVPEIYAPIIRYWHEGGFMGFIPELEKLLERQKPSADEAIKLVNCMLLSKIKSASDADGYVSVLSLIAKSEDKVLTDFVSIEQLTNIEDIELVASFLWAIPEKYRNDLINYVREKAVDLFDLCFAEHNTAAHIITPELIEKLKDSVSKKPTNYIYPEELACSLLHQMECQEEYSELRPAIAEFRKTNKCCQFISAPLQYENINEVKGSWLMFISKKELKELLNNKEIRSIAIQFCENNQRGDVFKKTLWELMK